MKTVHIGAALCLFAGVAYAQQLPPIRPLGPVVATSTEALGRMVFVRHVPGGVLVNDVQSRRLLLFDSTLTAYTVVADSTPATGNAYGGRTGALIAYRGDSSLFVDPQSMSMLVIDPAGKIARVMAIPRAQDAMTLGSGVFGTPGFDAAGRLVYRSAPRFPMRAAPAGGMAPPEMPDSAAIVRLDLATRSVDTVGFIKIQRIRMDVQRDDEGRIRMTSVTNPLPVVDEWAVLSDGSVALVRGRDYRVDWVRPDGSRESGAKMPFEWQRLTDEDKVAFIDSVQAARERIAQSAPPGPQPAASTTTGPDGEQRQVIMVGPGGGVPPGAAGGGGGGRLGGAGGRAQITFVPANELPDYKPPFFAGSVRAAADGHLWIRTIPTRAIAGGPVYDVVNGRGELVDRVQVPQNRTIVGFGRGGVVYLLAEQEAARKLEVARTR